MTSEKTGIEEMTLDEIKALARTKVKEEVWEWINGGTGYWDDVGEAALLWNIPAKAW